jgi:hypothetical protein
MLKGGAGCRLAKPVVRIPRKRSDCLIVAGLVNRRSPAHPFLSTLAVYKGGQTEDNSSSDLLVSALHSSHRNGIQGKSLSHSTVLDSSCVSWFAVSYACRN